jgi:hypothetical protein
MSVRLGTMRGTRGRDTPGTGARHAELGRMGVAGADQA